MLETGKDPRLAELRFHPKLDSGRGERSATCAITDPRFSLSRKDHWLLKYTINILFFNSVPNNSYLLNRNFIMILGNILRKGDYMKLGQVL